MKLKIPDEYMSNIKEVKSASKAVNWLPGKKKKKKKFLFILIGGKVLC